MYKNILLCVLLGLILALVLTISGIRAPQIHEDRAPKIVKVTDTGGTPFKEFPNELLDNSGELSFRIEAAHVSTKMVYFNSSRDYKSQNCKTIMVPLELYPEFKTLNIVNVRGWTIRAKGVVSERGIRVIQRGDMSIHR